MVNKDVFIWMDSFVCNLRQRDILAYCSWVEERLFLSFGTWEEEQQRAGDAYLERASQNFDPEFHDPGDFYEAAYEHSVEHCLKLAEVNSYMTGMAISGLYHLWEKQVLNHLEREIIRYVDKYQSPTKWEGICDVFKIFSVDMYSMPFSACLEELRLVTNVVKHGVGDSLQWLIASESSILGEAYASNEQPLTGGSYSMLGAPIYPQVDHFLKYKKAVLLFWDYEFWREYGERLYYVGP